MDIEVCFVTECPIHIHLGLECREGLKTNPQGSFSDAKGTIFNFRD